MIKFKIEQFEMGGEGNELCSPNQRSFSVSLCDSNSFQVTCNARFWFVGGFYM